MGAVNGQIAIQQVEGANAAPDFSAKRGSSEPLEPVWPAAQHRGETT